MPQHDDYCLLVVGPQNDSPTETPRRVHMSGLRCTLTAIVDQSIIKVGTFDESFVRLID